MRNLIPHFIQEEYQKENYEGNFEALTMFVDVSGFTPMTQALMSKGHEGAEILATILNDMFDLMVNAVYERGGFVSVFAGDAFTAIFPLSNPAIPADMCVLHVLACANRIQAIFRRHGIQTTPYGQFALQVKVGISQGRVDWGIIGHTEKTYFFRGEAIDSCAASEHHADKGELIFDKQVAPLLRKVPRTFQAEIRKIVMERLEGGYFHVKQIPETLLSQLEPPDVPPEPALDQDVVAHFLPESLIYFTERGEFRHVVAIFISFEGIATIAEFNDWAFVLIDNIKRFSGYFNHIDFGDKGGVVICGFGAPIAYENMIDRALSFMLAVKEDLTGFQNLSGLRFRAGVTYGFAYAGIAGGQKRCEYTFYGEVVNLAARFMMRADWGDVFVSEVIRSKTVQFNFEHKGDLTYKGIAEPVPTYVVISRKTGIRHQVFLEEMIGRRKELQQLQDFAAPIFARKFAGIAYIFGEAGVGKSRLSYALLEELTEQHDFTWFNCPADQILRKPFNPFIFFFMRYFEQSPDNPEADNKRRFEERYEALIEALSPLEEGQGSVDSPLEGGQGGVIPSREGPGVGILKELIRTKSVIGAQIGLFWKDSLWEQLDAKGKYENTLYAIKNFFLAYSLLKPVVIELEDGHWIDSDSLALLEVLTRNIADYPIFLLTTLRYNDDGSKSPFDLKGILPSLEIDLCDLSAEDVKLCAEAELKGSISDALHTMLVAKTKGNPFYVQQMVLYFVENKTIALRENQWHLVFQTLKLPDTINAVLIARIDRLSQKVKEMVKVAAVIGREFDVLLLSAVLKQDVLYQIKIVEQNQIWEELQELQYIFKHALIRDTAYQMQLRARLRELHYLTAKAMETVYAERLTEKYADLAFHYEKAENSDKAIEYLEKAGNEAKAKYQNRQALELYDRLLAQVHNVFGFEEIEIDALLNKAEILELTGNWKACQQVCEESLELAEQIDDKRRLGQAKLMLGIIYRRTGQHDRAMEHFKQAQELFEAVNEKAGIGHAFRNMGLVYWQKSDPDAAMACYEKALKICEEQGDTLGIARNATNIGILYTELKIDYDAAMTWYNKSLQLSEELGEKLGISRILNNIGECHRSQGNYADAITHYKQSLQLAEELGDKLQIAAILGNMGCVYVAQGDHNRALTDYDRAIAILRELENKYYLCSCLIDKADALFSLQRYEEAQTLNAEGLRIVEEIGDEEYIFKGKMLSVKIAFVLGNEDAPRRFEDMLQQTQDDAEIAALHYELWKMTRNEEYWQAALKLYQTLYKTTPNIEYKRRMEELQEG